MKKYWFCIFVFPLVFLPQANARGMLDRSHQNNTGGGVTGKKSPPRVKPPVAPPEGAEHQEIPNRDGFTLERTVPTEVPEWLSILPETESELYFVSKSERTSTERSARKYAIEDARKQAKRIKEVDSFVKVYINEEKRRSYEVWLLTKTDKIVGEDKK